MSDKKLYEKKIAESKEEIQNFKKQIGKYCYTQFKNREDDSEIDPEVLDLCQSIDATYDEITILENKLEKLK